MIYSYYPGCTLKTKAKDLDMYARRSAEALGVTLEEIPQWQCCGGVYTMGKDEIASKLSSVRALAYAKEKNRDLVTVCSACHHVIKRVNSDMKNDEFIRSRANSYLQLDEEYAGETNVIHYLELLRDKIGFDEIAKKVKNPLSGKKIAAYYGCMLLRPSKVMLMDNPENPTIIEDLIRALGGEPVTYAMRNECCGGYMTMEDKDLASKKSSKVLEDAVNNGADMVVTACPLCMYNLKKNGNADIPVLYFTELLASSLGVSEED